MLEILSSAKFRKLAEYPLHPDAWYVGFQQLWYGLWHHVPALPLLDRDGNPRVQEYITLMPGLSALLLAGVGFAVGAGDRAPLNGILAAAIALGAIVLAKVAVIAFVSTVQIDEISVMLDLPPEQAREVVVTEYGSAPPLAVQWLEVPARFESTTGVELKPQPLMSMSR